MDSLTIAAFCFALSFLYTVCGSFAYGLSFAYFQREWPEIAEKWEDRDRRMARMVAILGPFGLALALVMGGTRHGLKF
jgi:NhaP-type Na+/H+ or K+/H+ antiporter